MLGGVTLEAIGRFEAFVTVATFVALFAAMHALMFHQTHFGVVAFVTFGAGERTSYLFVEYGMAAQTFGGAK